MTFGESHVDIPTYTSDNFTVDQCNCSIAAHEAIPECDCIYDYDPDVPPPLEDILPLGFIYSFVFIIGILGNSMVIFVVARYKRMRSVTNVFLASLSTSDLFLIIFCIPVQYLKYLTYTWEMGEFLCHSVHYVQLFTMICSVLTLTAISIERYYAIAHPMKAMSWSTLGRAKRIICIIWTLAVLLAIPSWFTHTLESNITERNKTAIWCLEKFSYALDGSTLEKCYALYQTVVLFAVPVGVMTFCYVRVGRELAYANKHYNSPKKVTTGHRKQSVTVESKSGTSEALDKSCVLTANCAAGQQCQDTVLRKSTKMSDGSVNQIIHMLVAVVLLFTVCWSPYVIDDLLVAFNVFEAQSKTTTMKYLRMTFALMAYSNSCQNPLVYAFMSKHFSRKFKSLCCRCGKNADDDDKSGPQKNVKKLPQKMGKPGKMSLLRNQQKRDDKSLLHPNYGGGGRHSNADSSSSNYRKSSTSSKVCNL